MNTFGKFAHNKLDLAQVPRVAWSDIGGYEDVKQALQEMIEVFAAAVSVQQLCL